MVVLTLLRFLLERRRLRMLVGGSKYLRFLISAKIESPCTRLVKRLINESKLSPSFNLTSLNRYKPNSCVYSLPKILNV